MLLLRDGAKTSGELAQAFDTAWPTVSRHLAILRDADLVTAERDGTSIIYRANATVIEGVAATVLALLGRDLGDDDMKDAAE